MGKCDKQPEIYSRITGYFRPIANWNNAKQQEFKDRKTYNLKEILNVLPKKDRNI